MRETLAKKGENFPQILPKLKRSGSKTHYKAGSKISPNAFWLGCFLSHKEEEFILKTLKFCPAQYIGNRRKRFQRIYKNFFPSL